MCFASAHFTSDAPVRGSVSTDLKRPSALAQRLKLSSWMKGCCGLSRHERLPLSQ